MFYLRSGFPHSFVRSKLSVLPEEQGTMTRRRARDTRQSRATSVVGETGGPQSLTSEVSTMGVITTEVTSPTPQVGVSVQRKRSQSLADIQVSNAPPK